MPRHDQFNQIGVEHIFIQPRAADRHHVVLELISQFANNQSMNIVDQLCDGCLYIIDEAVNQSDLFLITQDCLSHQRITPLSIKPFLGHYKSFGLMLNQSLNQTINPPLPSTFDSLQPLINTVTATLTMLEALRICSSSVSPNERSFVVSMCEWYGAVYQANFDQSITHLISGSSLSDKVSAANRCSCHVVSLSWLVDSLRNGVRVEERAHALKPLTNTRISMTGFLVETRDELKKLIEQNGGEFHADFRKGNADLPGTTHLVCFETGWDKSAKYQAARLWGVPCVDQVWLRESCLFRHMEPVEIADISLSIEERARLRAQHRTIDQSINPNDDNDDVEAFSQPPVSQPIDSDIHSNRSVNHSRDQTPKQPNKKSLDISINQSNNQSNNSSKTKLSTSRVSRSSTRKSISDDQSSDDLCTNNQSITQLTHQSTNQSINQSANDSRCITPHSHIEQSAPASAIMKSINQSNTKSNNNQSRPSIESAGTWQTKKRRALLSPPNSQPQNNQSINQSTNQPTNQFADQSMNQSSDSANLSMNQSTTLSTRQSNGYVDNGMSMDISLDPSLDCADNQPPSRSRSFDQSVNNPLLVDSMDHLDEEPLVRTIKPPVSIMYDDHTPLPQLTAPMQPKQSNGRKSSRSSTNQNNNQPINQPINQSSNPSVNQPNKRQSLVQSVDYAQSPTDESPSSPSPIQSVRRATIQPTKPSVTRSTNQSINQSTNQSIDQSTYQSIIQSTSSSSKRSNNQTNKTSLNQSAKKSSINLDYSDDPPNDQPMEQSNNQTIEQFAEPGDYLDTVLACFVGMPDQSISQLTACLIDGSGTRFPDYRPFLTHIIGTSRSMIDQAIKQSRYGHMKSNRTITMVSVDWLIECSANRQMLDETPYLLPHMSAVEMELNKQSVNQSINRSNSIITSRPRPNSSAFVEPIKPTKPVNPVMNQSINQSMPLNQTLNRMSATTGIFSGCAFKVFNIGWKPSVKYVKIIRENGGIVSEDLSEGIPYVVAFHWTPEIMLDPVIKEFPNQSKIHYVTPFYLEQCDVFKRKLRPRHSPLYSPLPELTSIKQLSSFKRVNVTFSGFVGSNVGTSEVELLTNVVKALGGNVSSTMTQHTTHLVAKFPDSSSPKWQTAKQKGMCILRPRWIVECAIGGQRIDEAEYVWTDDDVKKDLARQSAKGQPIERQMSDASDASDALDGDTALMQEFASMDDDELDAIQAHAEGPTSELATSLLEEADSRTDVQDQAEHIPSVDELGIDASPIVPIVNIRNRKYVPPGSTVPSFTATPPSTLSARKRRAAVKPNEPSLLPPAVSEFDPFNFEEASSLSNVRDPIIKHPPPRELPPPVKPAVSRTLTPAINEAIVEHKQPISKPEPKPAPLPSSIPPPVESVKERESRTKKLIISSDLAVAAASKSRTARTTRPPAPAVFRQFTERLEQENQTNNRKANGRETSTEKIVAKATDIVPEPTAPTSDKPSAKSNASVGSGVVETEKNVEKPVRGRKRKPSASDESNKQDVTLNGSTVSVEEARPAKRVSRARKSAETPPVPPPETSAVSSRSRRKGIPEAVVEKPKRGRRSVTPDTSMIDADGSPGASQSLARRTRKNKVYVIALIAFSPESRENYVIKVEKLGGRVVDDGCELQSVTHVVACAIKRSERVTAAIAAGLPILRHHWIDQSFETGQWKDVDGFEVGTAGTKVPVSFLDAMKRWKHKRPFDQLSFILLCSDSVTKVMRHVITMGGGTIVQEIDHNVLNAEKQPLVIIEKPRDLAAVKLIYDCGLTAYRPDYVFDFVAPKEATYPHIFVPDQYAADVQQYLPVDEDEVVEVKPVKRRK